jgi:MoaA/NifB/PqqE/SkfB family radical SAM enzyme
MRFKTVVVMNPPNPPGHVSNKDSMGGFGHLFPLGATKFPPLDLIYLASFLVEEGVPVQTLECLGLEYTKEQAVEAMRQSAGAPGAAAGEGVLLVARTSSPTLDWDLEVCTAIKAAYGGLAVAIYGAVVPHVLARIQREAAIDYIVLGEPDDTVLALARGEDELQIDGLIWRGGDSWVHNRERGFAKDLDRLPFPKWELFPYRAYHLPKSSAHSEDVFLPMWTSRGCPVGCHYCPYPVGQGLLWRLRSPENVVDEIEHLVKDLNVRYILFRDPIFSLNQNRVLRICEEINRRGLEVEWRCETRVDCLRDETLAAMAKAGCRGINFGVESAEVEIQANVGRKPITREQFIHTIGLCHKLGVSTFGFFIIGLPGDTATTILDTIKFAIDMRTNWVQFTAASPFIGTKLRDWAINHGFATPDEYAYVNSYDVKMGNENLTKEQIGELLTFAQFIGTYFINRKGLLKAENRHSGLYGLARSAVDTLSLGAARAYYAVGRRRLERRIAADNRAIPAGTQKAAGL